ncbi:energy-coupling factor ABC transporter ATP-binding protein [Microvirga tunisiensis]|uniref:ABC transporter ATP-binding protein n=1 Tax=Microvirga tunisiensis TaxID=2108360 RepID=A0A5N7ML53_9HYPH|nr:ABC transporter ATP-binding protein [Microvirga tunisiensis]MPR08979.1 ABC transporter ATP-binding protein [Microvirga tunisiensis]MPR27179.1 ABC transporter ATP-binding protein [Microvirga tunisiensis]
MTEGAARLVRPNPHIIFDQATFAHGERVVFDGFSLSLQERRIGLIGSNGSGKSSLLRLAHGLALPAGGIVTTLGLNTGTHRKQIPSQVGFLFQNPDRQIIFPTVGEEIAFGFQERGDTRREAMHQALVWLSRFGRTDWFERVVHDLSEGQKQLVCLISVLALEPSLILLDEPFASLDLSTRLAFADQLQALDQPIVMASHDLDFLAPFDRVVWLEQGRVRADGPPRDVLEAYRAEAHRGMRELV